VLTVFAWAVEVVEQYVAEIRPCFGAPRHPAMFLTERGTRSHAATTAVYMSVGDDFKDRLVRAAIDEQLIQLMRTQ
jgi:hypothetical protein